MYFRTFASGSSGNCTFVSAKSTHILIDAGISMKRTVEALKRVDKNISELEGILITHDHSDHIAGLKMLSEKCKVPVYASDLTADSLVKSGACNKEVIRTFRAGESFSLGDIEVQSFKTPHDAIGSVGFRLECKGESLAYVTDLGYMPDKIMKIIEGSDVVLLEANHDVDMLRSGAYPPFLQHRIHSDEGHLSNDAAALCALELVKCGTKLIVLAHLSDKNNTPDIALKTVRTMLEKAGYYCELEVAPRSSDGKIYEVALCDILN